MLNTVIVQLGIYSTTSHDVITITIFIIYTTYSKHSLAKSSDWICSMTSQRCKGTAVLASTQDMNVYKLCCTLHWSSYTHGVRSGATGKGWATTTIQLNLHLDDSLVDNSFVASQPSVRVLPCVYRNVTVCVCACIHHYAISNQQYNLFMYIRIHCSESLPKFEKILQGTRRYTYNCINNKVSQYTAADCWLLRSLEEHDW